MLVSPANGSTRRGTSPSLVGTRQRSWRRIADRHASRPQSRRRRSSRSSRCPDTQHYSEAFPPIFTSQTQWIVNNKAARNIVFVTHEGDIVEHNSLTTEWQRANTSMSLLDGVVPYGMGPGNHDQPTTLYNQYFPYTRYQGLPWYGGHYREPERQQLPAVLRRRHGLRHRPPRRSARRRPPSPGPIRSSSRIPNRIGIMTTHGYLGLGAVSDPCTSCGSTQYLWDGLARAESEPALHAERPRPRRIAPHGHGQRASRCSRCWPTIRIEPAAAKAGCASCGSCRPRTRSTSRRIRRG